MHSDKDQQATDPGDESMGSDLELQILVSYLQKVIEIGKAPGSKSQKNLRYINIWLDIHPKSMGSGKSLADG